MHQIKQKRILSAMLSLLLLASAVSCSADEGQTKISDSTKTETAAITEAETEIETEPVVTETEIITEAVTEGPSVTEDVHADEGIVNVKPTPIRRTDDWIDMEASYNQPKVDLTEIVEGLIARDVYVGRGGWMFYTDSIDNFLGTDLYSSTMLKRIGNMLQKRSDWCAENGITFYFMIAPNKNTIYPEKMMSSMQEGEEKRIDQIYDYLAANTTVKTIDVRDALFAEKEANPNADLYYPLDTHWNNYGGFIAYQSIMDTVLKDFPTAVKHTADEYQVDYFDSHFKDCAYYLGYYDLMKSESPVYTMISGKTGKVAWHDGSGEFGQFVHAYIDPETGYQESCYNMGYVNEYAPDAPSLYIIRDSFFMAMSPFLRDSFSKVTSTWRTDFPTSNILKEDPDILIFECVEAQMDAVFGQKTLG